MQYKGRLDPLCLFFFLLLFSCKKEKKDRKDDVKGKTEKKQDHHQRIILKRKGKPRERTKRIHSLYLWHRHERTMSGRQLLIYRFKPCLQMLHEIIRETS
jgi:hypothetical protein